MLGGLQFCHCTEWCRAGTLGESTEGFAINCLHQSLRDGRCSTQPKWHPIYSHRLHWGGEHYLGLFFWFYLYLVDCIRVVKSSQLPAKIAAYLFSIGQLLCLVFLYRSCRFVEIKYAWTGRLLWQLSRLLQNFLTTLRYTDDRSMSEKYGAMPSTSSETSVLDKRYMSSLLFTKRGSSPCIGREVQTSCILIWSGMHSCPDWVW